MAHIPETKTARDAPALAVIKFGGGERGREAGFSDPLLGAGRFVGDGGSALLACV